MFPMARICSETFNFLLHSVQFTLVRFSKNWKRGLKMIIKFWRRSVYWKEEKMKIDF